jgi:hypothetical protein
MTATFLRVLIELSTLAAVVKRELRLRRRPRSAGKKMDLA